MRVLLTDHFPLRASTSGQHCRRLAEGLLQAGNQVRVVTLADASQPTEAFPLQVVTCRGDDPQADLPIPLPGFDSVPPAGMTFGGLSDLQLAAYREKLRQAIDHEVAEFNPHVIHCQHVWIEGQLALETGVPYILSAWEVELAAIATDARYRPLAEQGAENASRIVVPNRSLADRLTATFEAVSQRLVVLPEVFQADAATASQRMAEIYHTAFQERFGSLPI